MCRGTPLPSDEPSVPLEDLEALHYLYTNNTHILCGTLKLDVLARLFSHVYGPSMPYGGLRHIIIAIFMSRSGTRTAAGCPSLVERRHVDVTFAELSRQLSNPTAIHESDIFIAYLLALWSCDVDPTATEVHIEGVVAILRHLSRKMGCQFLDSPMFPFWAFLRDEILWLARKWNSYHRFCQDFRDILGPKTIQQRQRYESELRRVAMLSQPQDTDGKIFFGRSINTSVHTMIELAKVIERGYHRSEQDPIVESILVELHIEQRSIEQKGRETLLDLDLKPLQHGDYVADWEIEARVVDHIHNLIVLYLCRLATLALEASSIEDGLGSPAGVAASAALIWILYRSRGFFLAGIQGNRVFGKGTYCRSPIADKRSWLLRSLSNKYELAMHTSSRSNVGKGTQ